MTSVLIVGLDPSLVDPNDPAVPPGTTSASIERGIHDTLAAMAERGWKAAHCAITTDETAETAIAKTLQQSSWDVVVIGAGVRLPPQNMHLFERVVNVVRKAAPDAAIAFNVSPLDSVTAAKRWLGEA
jgi:hypothetical protein